MRTPSMPTLLILLLISLLCLSACSDVTLHEEHDHAAEGMISTPDEAVDYILTFEDTVCLASRGGAVAKEGDDVVIIKAGVYRLKGHFKGQLRVSVADTEHVTLIMDDFSITSPKSAALHVVNAGCVYVEVPEGKTATLTDAVEYQYDTPGENKPNACIYAADDITFRGLGRLVVNGNYNNGIGCNNDIVFMSGDVTVQAKNNGIKGVGGVHLIHKAKVTVTGAEDGIKSDGIDKKDGVIVMSGEAVAYISCADDALQAVYDITVKDSARLYYECDGSIVNSDGSTHISDGALIYWD